MLHEHVELIIELVGWVANDSIHDDHYNGQVLRLQEVFYQNYFDYILNVDFFHILVVDNFIDKVAEVRLSYEKLGKMLN